MAKVAENRKKNIVLIGMPGCGKSTVGVVLAKKMGFSFLDSDLLIQKQYHKLLHELIAQHGIEHFCKMENDVNASIDCTDTVIATGGSTIYGEEAMRHLKKIGLVFYLNLPYGEMEARLGDLDERGVIIREGQTLWNLYEERTPLYEKYADVIVSCAGRQIKDIVAEIAEKYQELKVAEDV